MGSQKNALGYLLREGGYCQGVHVPSSFKYCTGIGFQDPGPGQGLFAENSRIEPGITAIRSAVSQKRVASSQGTSHTASS